MDFISDYFLKFSKDCLNIPYAKIKTLVEELKKLRENNGRLFILGVGGSAGNASHAVNDFRKLCNIEAYAPTDNVSELTARTNDEGFDTIFSEYLKVSKINSKDAIMIFSVGGGSLAKNVSLNLISAIKVAKAKQLKIFSLVGKDDGYAANNSNISIVIPVQDKTLITPISEAFQAVIWHCIVSHPSLALNATKW
ncbi:MAG: SIS domain-containing protein [Pelagibacterales bacterium]|mgnify:CR=1 FL=1|jgi:D-sedoheptulose 7-phosphate isomerase|nr:SIS domain-containing protein [Pelagibacterales bacterium]MBT7076289.1 SIS domain-containing protein [Pelagibacterales bacterium]